jgi:hypothetical protein
VPVTSVTLPALAAIVPAARRMVRAIMDGTPHAYDVEVIASEMITRTVLYPLSGELTLEIRTDPGYARIEVSDAAGSAERPTGHACPDAEHGQRWLIIDALAGRWVSYGTITPDGSSDKRGLWAEIAWQPSQP